MGSVDAKVLVVPCFSQCLRLFLCGYASSSVVGGVLIRCTSHGALHEVLVICPCPFHILETMDTPLERGALMITRRTLEGALKCSLRDLRREL